MPPKKKKGDNWQYCEGRKLLLKDLKEGVVTEDMEWLDVFDMRPDEYNVGKDLDDALRLFPARFKSACDIHMRNKNRAAQELGMLQQDRTTVKVPAYDSTGLPRWEGLMAERLLKEDIQIYKKHLTQSTQQIYTSRPQYQVYGKRYITRKIEQIQRTDKFLAQMGDNKK